MFKIDFRGIFEKLRLLNKLYVRWKREIIFSFILEQLNNNLFQVFQHLCRRGCLHK